MTVVPLRSRQKTNLRRRAPAIYDAAARIFAERGFYGASTQDIADVLGIRQASLYYYFASKEAALELVCIKGVEGFFESASAIAKGPGNCANRLSRLIDSHLAPLDERGDYVKVFLNERQHLPEESRRKVGKWSRGLERIFEDVLKEGVRKGEFRSDMDTRLVTLAILGMLNWVTLWYRKEDVPISRISGEFSQMVLDGLRDSRTRRKQR
jgi:TetR/AcrR family transcriptional regulator, cholesterol catabolism regulator